MLSHGIGSVQIPQPQGAQQTFLRRRLQKVRAARQIRRKLCNAVGLRGVEGQVDLVESRSRQQCFLLFGQQGPVGGEDNPETQFPGLLQQF